MPSLARHQGDPSNGSGQTHGNVMPLLRDVSSDYGRIALTIEGLAEQVGRDVSFEEHGEYIVHNNASVHPETD